MSRSHLRGLYICAPVVAFLLASCTSVGHRYDYTPVRQAYAWGQVTAGLNTTTSSYRDGVAVMGGPHRFVVTVWINEGAAVPATCKVRFKNAVLLDAKGAVEARIAPTEVTRQTSVDPGDDPWGKQAQMYMSTQADQLIASAPHDIVEVPFADHQVVVDVSLEGCGVADGDHQLRDVLRTDYKTWRFNGAFEAAMSV